MKNVFSAILLLTTLTSMIAMAQTKCQMSIAQQRQMILSEAQKAVQGKGSECFESLLKSQMDVLKKAGAANAEDRASVIQDLYASAIKAEIFESGNAE